MRRAGIVGIAAAMAVSLTGVPGTAQAAAAGSVVVVHGTELPLGLQLSFVGCQSLFSRADESLQPYVGIGPGTPPLGERSLGYHLAGGDGVGSLAFVPDLGAAAPTSVSVYAAQGTTGVAYAGYTSPSQHGTQRMWIGRAPLTVPAGAWTSFQTGDLTYTWTQVNVANGRTITATDPLHTPPPATAHDFTVMQHGAGAGFLTLDFGCDGAPFDLDAMHVGTTTYDFEGLETAASISASATTVAPDKEVTLTGSLRDSSGAFVPAGTLTLEARDPGGTWQAVQVVDASASDPSVTVTPKATTEYRFTSPERELADATASAPVTVTVADPSPSPSSSPAPSSTSTPTAAPSQSPTAQASTPHKASAAPNASSSPTRSPKPAPKPTPSPSAAATAASPSASASR